MIMNDIHILMWMVGGGFVLMGIMLRHMNSRMDALESKLSGDILGTSVRIDTTNVRMENIKISLESKIDRMENGLNTKIDKLTEKVEDIDRRLCRIEGSLATQGHCLFNQDKTQKKAE